MKRLFSLAVLALVALAPAAAQRGTGGRPMMGVPGGSVADVLSRRALVLTDTLGLDDAQQTRLRSLLADRLDTLAAQAARTSRPRDERRRPEMRPQDRPEGGPPGGFRSRRDDRPAFRPDRFDALHEPLFAALDPAVRALLTAEQAARYDAFRARERVRAEALRAARDSARTQSPAPRGNR